VLCLQRQAKLNFLGVGAAIDQYRMNAARPFKGDRIKNKAAPGKAPQGFILHSKPADPDRYGTQPKLTLTQPGKWVSKIPLLRVFHGFFDGCDAVHLVHRATRFLHKGTLK
jgi:hypothetical protein